MPGVISAATVQFFISTSRHYIKSAGESGSFSSLFYQDYILILESTNGQPLFFCPYVGPVVRPLLTTFDHHKPSFKHDLGSISEKRSNQPTSQQSLFQYGKVCVCVRVCIVTVVTKGRG